MTALVGFLRSQYASRMEDTSFEDLITELSRSSPEFSRMWRGRATEKLLLVYDLRLSTSRLGILSFHSTRFILADRPGDLLFVLVPADDRTAAIVEKERRGLGASPSGKSRRPEPGSSGRVKR
jgi:hypothetical protein